MTSLPPVVPRLPTENPYRRHLAPGSAFLWLRAGWRDLMTMPAPSLARGSIAFLISVAIIAGLVFFQMDYVLFPALAALFVTTISSATFGSKLAVILIEILSMPDGLG